MQDRSSFAVGNFIEYLRYFGRIFQRNFYRMRVLKSIKAHGRYDGVSAKVIEDIELREHFVNAKILFGNQK